MLGGANAKVQACGYCFSYGPHRGGCKGAAIGAGVGAGTCTAAREAAHGEQVKVPSEAKIEFVLKNDLTIDK